MRTVGLFTGAINNTIQRYNATRGCDRGYLQGKIFHNIIQCEMQPSVGFHLLILAGTSLWWWVGALWCSHLPAFLVEHHCHQSVFLAVLSVPGSCSLISFFLLFSWWLALRGDLALRPDRAYFNYIPSTAFTPAYLWIYSFFLNQLEVVCQQELTLSSAKTHR